MNIEIANRLVELRKKNGLSQEELADKLGLSRQAVSKWERAESSPDTDNLICLAKLYNVSLDDLLNSDQSIEEISSEVKERNEEESLEKALTEKNIKKAIKESRDKKYAHLPEKDRKRAKIFDIVDAAITGAMFLVVTIIYIVVSSYHAEQWGKLWILYFLPIIISSFFTCFKNRRFSSFAMPILCTFLFMGFGLYMNFWHPMWVVFLAIPVYYIVFGPIDTAIANYRHEPKNPEDPEDEDEE